jgi:hypothetical protein
VLAISPRQSAPTNGPRAITNGERAYSVPLSLPATASFHRGNAGARLTLMLNTPSGSETLESDRQTVSVG